MRHTMEALAVALFAVACGSTGGTRLDSLASRAGPGGGGGEEETAGNNLGVPVIWPEGVAVALQGTMLAPNLAGASVNVDGKDWYIQKDPNNLWQAENVALTPGVDPPLYVSTIDWGDNLESSAVSSAGVVRVETSLYRTLETPMQGYTMQWLSGEGTTEVWGTDGTLYSATEAMVYSPAARLTIQKFTQPPSTAVVTWNAAEGKWDGDLEAPCFNGVSWETVDGPEGFAAEINVAGKIVYGYNWKFKHSQPEPGTWRVTFSLDGTNYPGTLNTFFDANTVLLASAEGEEETGGSSAVIVPANNLTYIDVSIGVTNYPPKAVADAFGTPEDTPLKVAAPGVLVNDSDGDSATITAVLVTGVTHGTLSLQPDGSFEYIPNPDFHGMDTFSYKANDGTLDSAAVTVPLTVASVNDLPTAPVLLTPAEGTKLSDPEVVFTWMPSTDVDGDALSYLLEVLDKDTVVRHVNVTDISAALTGDQKLPAGSYAWRVQASDPTASGGLSTLRHFTIEKKSSSSGFFCSVSGVSSAANGTLPAFGALALAVSAILLRRRTV